MAEIEQLLLQPAVMVQSYLHHHFEDSIILERLRRQLGEPQLEKLPYGVDRLTEAIRYSLLQTGGKRFRPALTLLTAEVLGAPYESVMPFAAAVECIHTYSLIHDDLPAMDDDKERRGSPTNHIKFDEATAILAGDALLTEAFGILADAYASQPQIISELTLILSRSSGIYGMVGGQVMDMTVQGEIPNQVRAIMAQLPEKNDRFTLMRRLHRMKTGALIRAAVHGATVICETPAAKLRDLVVFADLLGLAFQVADDLLDHKDSDPESCSFTTILGVDSTRRLLQDLTDAALGALRVWPDEADTLREIARYNAARLK